MAFAEGQDVNPVFHPRTPPPVDADYPPPPPLPSYDSHYVHHHPPAVPDMFHVHPDQERIHTLFVSGLPDDIKARDIHNVFCGRPGFDHCLLEYTGRGNQAGVSQ